MKPNNKKRRCSAGREYFDKETNEVIGRVQCGYDKKHLGPHTFEQEQVSVVVQIRLVELPEMRMQCPGCEGMIKQIISGQIAQAIHGGAEPNGQCQNCGFPVRFCKQRLIVAAR